MFAELFEELSQKHGLDVVAKLKGSWDACEMLAESAKGTTRLCWQSVVIVVDRGTERSFGMQRCRGHGDGFCAGRQAIEKFVVMLCKTYADNRLAVLGFKPGDDNDASFSNWQRKIVSCELRMWYMTTRPYRRQ